MDNSIGEDAARRLQDQAREHISDLAQLASQAQRQFLTSRSGTLRQIADLVSVQAGSPLSNATPVQPVLFDRVMLEEFATGSIERCLGEDYAVFRERRVPRIPNGALLLMDRILEINGTRGKPNLPSEIITEYDVPADAWFFQDSGSDNTPYSILMEMALQPCGFLTAYLGTMLISPDCNLYFRNLDGDARLNREVDLRGKTVRAWARMVSHTLNEETVIQKFEFRLETQHRPFYEGTSVFGFFPEETMLRQLGLDNGKGSLPEYLKTGPINIRGKMIDLDLPSTGREQPGLRLSGGRLALLDQVYIDPRGGSQGLGYIYASRDIDQNAWFFHNHFYQDPVMPGSLGVEAILESMRIFALEQGYAATLQHASFSLDESLLQWKYRGQILKTTQTMLLEVDIRRVEQDQSGIVIAGDASLWADSIRIYQVKNAAIRILRGY
jgi:3-hydroxymyristoyl/3-hydroxydecanoyl-(acyl carrier protein) dehydratase